MLESTDIVLWQTRSSLMTLSIEFDSSLAENWSINKTLLLFFIKTGAISFIFPTTALTEKYTKKTNLIFNPGSCFRFIDNQKYQPKYQSIYQINISNYYCWQSSINYECRFILKNTEKNNSRKTSLKNPRQFLIYFLLNT